MPTEILTEQAFTDAKQDRAEDVGYAPSPISMADGAINGGDSPAGGSPAGSNSPLLQKEQERVMRPQSLQDFTGQEAIKENLHIFIKAAKQRSEPLDHTLLYGPPGLGKTTIAGIIAAEMGVNFRVTSGPVLAKAGDLAAILSSLAKGDVLFIDEIHRLNKKVEEVLYPAIEDFTLDIIIGEGAGARTVQINLEPFTLIGATTRLGLISNPLKDRFGIPLKLNFYQNWELQKIIARSYKIFGTNIEQAATAEIAMRSRGTPRIALRLARRVRDFAMVKNISTITKDFADEMLNKLGIDKIGLDEADKQYLQYLVATKNGSAIGIETLSAALSEAKSNLEEDVEPYLIQQGLIEKTPRGRIITAKALKHMGLF